MKVWITVIRVDAHSFKSFLFQEDTSHDCVLLLLNVKIIYSQQSLKHILTKTQKVYLAIAMLLRVETDGSHLIFNTALRIWISQSSSTGVKETPKILEMIQELFWMYVWKKRAEGTLLNGTWAGIWLKNPQRSFHVLKVSFAHHQSLQNHYSSKPIDSKGLEKAHADRPEP